MMCHSCHEGSLFEELISSASLLQQQQLAVQARQFPT